MSTIDKSDKALEQSKKSCATRCQGTLTKLENLFLGIVCLSGQIPLWSTNLSFF